MNDIARQFQELKPRLSGIWRQLGDDASFPHTSVIVPSLSVNQEELAKVVGAAYYEERLLFAIIRLRNPNARVIYVTSQPINPDIVDYYLQLLDGVPVRHARERLHTLSVWDSSSRPLTEKILERPRLVGRLRKLLGEPGHAYLTCYNSTPLERQLAVELGIPLNGVDPDLLSLGSKSGNRKIFQAAGVDHPDGAEDLHSVDDIVAALVDLGQREKTLERAVVKINEGFGGEGNGVFTFPAERDDAGAVRDALLQLERTSVAETMDDFLRKFSAMGGIVEALVELSDVRSPSVQMRVSPDGDPTLVSSHEQVLGGATGQSYLGCRFPADSDYRPLLLDSARRIGTALAEAGAIGRFGIDYLAGRTAAGEWRATAIEINLRMSGTTPPFMALEFLTGGGIDATTGEFLAPDGTPKYYSATDNLKSPHYRGFLAEDLIDIVARHGLGYRHATGTGALFHMIGALSQYGKVGVTCIGNDPAEASAIFERVTSVLDREANGDGHGEATPLLDRYLMME